MDISEKKNYLDLLIQQRNKSLENVNKARENSIYLGLAYFFLNFIIVFIFTRYIESHISLIVFTLPLSLAYLYIVKRLFNDACAKYVKADETMLNFLYIHYSGSVID